MMLDTIYNKGFITQYTNVYPEGYCQYLIDEFERLVKNGAGYNRRQAEGAPKHAKNDLSYEFNIRMHGNSPFEERSMVDVFFDGLQRCFEQYTEEFSILKNAKIHASVMKMQRTDPGGGYHIWHSEQNSGPQANRALVYMLYLNTLSKDAAGETEFLYQQVRIPPQENTMVLWPAAYTHTHRGNTVFGNNSKYILTGWFYYE